MTTGSLWRVYKELVISDDNVHFPRVDILKHLFII